MRPWVTRTWAQQPGRHGAAATERLTTALARLDPQATARRAELLAALTRSRAMHGDRSGSRRAFAEARSLTARLDDALLEAKVLTARYGAYLDDAAGRGELATETDAATARLRELCDRIDDVDTEILARQIRLRTLARLGRMPEYRAELERMAEVVVGLRSPFWHYVLSHLDAMLQLHDGRLADAEEASTRCLQAGRRLVGEDNTGTHGLRMFVIRREQDRLAPLAPFVRRLVRTEDAGAFWTPGLMLMLADIGEMANAAVLLAEVRGAGFDVPPDAMWGTVMALLAEATTAIGDRASARLLTERLAAQSGTALVTGHGIVSFGSADRHLGMLALVLDDPELAERHLVAAAEADTANGALLWAAHDRRLLADARERQGRPEDAARLRAVVERVAQEHGYARLARLVSAASIPD